MRDESALIRNFLRSGRVRVNIKIIVMFDLMNKNTFLRIRDGTVTFYMAIYNYGGSEATVNVEILESTTIVPDYIIPKPLKCGTNAFCDQNVCVCSPGYYPDPSPEDACTFNSCDQSIITCQVQKVENFPLTLTRSIGLPPDTPVAQKFPDQR